MKLNIRREAIPRPVFDEVHGFPRGVKLGEDFILWIHIALNYKVAFLNKPVAYYNQDVDVTNRGVRHLHKPEEHMLWKLSDLEDVEHTNQDYKQLIDKLRVYSLMPYFKSDDYRKLAEQELNKVDWLRQPLLNRLLYHMPIWALNMLGFFLRIGSKIKQLFRTFRT